jgi:hypothetical protein
MRLKSNKMEPGTRFHGWLSVEFEETDGATLARTYKIEGFFKPVIQSATSDLLVWSIGLRGKAHRIIATLRHSVSHSLRFPRSISHLQIPCLGACEHGFTPNEQTFFPP